MENAISTSANIHVFICWVPVISMFGICFPMMFLGEDFVLKLRKQGNQGRWFNVFEWAPVHILFYYSAY